MAFVERKLENISWDNPGTKVQGRLMKINLVKFDDGGTGLRYAVMGLGNVVSLFRGATNLDARLSPADVGSLIYVEYLGEDESRSMAANRSRPKLFKVMVDSTAKAKPEAAADETLITDDDIPF